LNVLKNHKQTHTHTHTHKLTHTHAGGNVKCEL